MSHTRRFLSRMDEWNPTKPLSVLGATGSGKTELVLHYLRAKKIRKEECLLVSLDSVAAYTELDIGSAKVHGTDRSEFDWVGLDLASIDQPMHAAFFRDSILPTIELAKKNSRKIIFVGGSHFYERFLVEGAAPGEASDPEFAETLKLRGPDDVRADLLSHDKRFEWIHANDSYRIFRYADLVLRQNLSFDELQENAGGIVNSVDTLILEVNPAALEECLRARIETMFRNGWINETRALIEKFGAAAPGLQTTGYFEIKESLLGKIPPAELEEKILIRHRQLAKQQRTWLRSMRAPDFSSAPDRPT